MSVWYLRGDSGGPFNVEPCLPQLLAFCIFFSFFSTFSLVRLYGLPFCKKMEHRTDHPCSHLSSSFCFFVFLSWRLSQLDLANLLQFCLSIILSMCRYSDLVSNLFIELPFYKSIPLFYRLGYLIHQLPRHLNVFGIFHLLWSALLYSSTSLFYAFIIFYWPLGASGYNWDKHLCASSSGYPESPRNFSIKKKD